MDNETKVEYQPRPKTKEFTSSVTGRKYTFQRVKPMQWLDLMDSVEDGDGRNRRKLYDMVLTNVVVQPPSMSLNDFDDFAEVDEVVTAATKFQRNK